MRAIPRNVPAPALENFSVSMRDLKGSFVLFFFLSFSFFIGREREREGVGVGGCQSENQLLVSNSVLHAPIACGLMGLIRVAHLIFL